MTLRAFAPVLVAVLVAPPLAAVAFLILTGLFRFGLPALGSLGDVLPLAISPYSWLIAGVPALVVGVVNAVAARLLPTQGLRLLLALPVGAVAFALSLNWLVQDAATGASGWAQLLALALAGALASLVCVALVESFGRTPDPA